MLSEYLVSLKGDKVMPRKNGAVFIVFEGPDGAGKTTQAGILKTYLDGKGIKSILTKEPTADTEAGRKVRQILNSGEKVDAKEIQNLFIGDRREHLEKEIIPALNEGKIIICDRYFYSTFAYGYIKSPNIDELVKMNESFIQPDITILLLADPEKCILRLADRQNKNDSFEQIDKLKKINEGYQMVMKRFPNVIAVNGDARIEEIHKEIINLLEGIIK